MQSRARVLQDRLIAFGVRASVVARHLRHDHTHRHMASQLARAATSPAAHYAEACDAESREDFIHKMKGGAKELREASVWLKMARGVGLPIPDMQALESECDQLIAIFIASIKTARTRGSAPKAK